MSEALTTKRDMLDNVNTTGDTIRLCRFHPLAHLFPWVYYDTSRCALPHRLTIALTTKRNSTMLAMRMLNQTLLVAPPGISPDVQSRINALFGETRSRDASSPLLDAQTGLSNVGDGDDIPESGNDELSFTNGHNEHNEPALSEDESKPQLKTAKDAGEPEHIEPKRRRKRRTRGMKLTLSRPKFIARYAYPSRSRASLPSSPTPPQPRSAYTSTSETPSPLSYLPDTRSLFSMVAEAVYYLSRYIKPYLPVPFSFRLPFLTSEPAMIKYSDAEIELKTRVYVKAQKPQLLCEAAHEKVIRVIGFMASGEDDTNECADLGDEVVKPLEIKARPKRLRQILKEEGRYVPEDLYGKEIGAALRRLRE